MTRRLALLLSACTVLIARPVKGARLAARRPKRDSNTKAAAVGDASAGPLVFELTAEERWPIRGLDPVLHIGGVAIESYQFGNAENTLLIFTCYDASQLQEGATVFLRYGQDESSRTSFPNFAWSNVR